MNEPGDAAAAAARAFDASAAPTSAPGVLVLDSDSRAGLACVQSLGARGARVHAGARRDDAVVRHSRWCERFLVQPAHEPIGPALQWLRGLDAAHGYSLIVPSTEGSLRWLRALPDDDPLRRKAQLPGDRAIDAALDKAVTARMAQDLGIAVPRSQLLERSAAGTTPLPPLGFPAVLKPAHSKVVIDGQLRSLSVEMAHDAARRDAVLGEWLPHVEVLEQLWVTGHGVGVELMFDRGRLLWSFMHERLHELPLTGGASSLRRAIAPRADLVDASTRLLQRLDWHGVAMVEWRCTHEGVAHLMEINPRLWGSLPLTIAAGIDVPRHLLALALAGQPPASAGYRVGTTARVPVDDLQWTLENWRADKSDPLLLTQPQAQVLAGWLAPLLGREHWDGWRLDDLPVLVRELGSFAAFFPRLLLRRLSRRLRRPRPG